MSRCSNDACASPLGDGGKKTCGACRAVKYCGKACQKAHWKVHKPRCADLANYRLRVQLDGKVNPDGTRSTRQEVGEAQISRRVNFVPPPPPTDPRNDFSDVDVDDPHPTYVPQKYNALPDNDCAKAFELIVAVQHERPDVIRDLCYVKKYNPNWVTKDGMSPMVIACGRGEVDVIQALLECGSRPDLVCPMDAQGETIPAFLGLVLGAMRPPGYEQAMDLVVASLKNYKFDLNKVVASTGCTCLLMAAQMDNPVAIKSLIKHGADPNLRVAKSDQLNGGGMSALHMAVMNGTMNAAVALLEGGADPDLRERNLGETPLMACLWNLRVDFVPLILKYTKDIWRPRDDRWNAMQIARQVVMDRGDGARECYDIVQKILRAGDGIRMVNHRDRLGYGYQQGEFSLDAGTSAL